MSEENKKPAAPKIRKEKSERILTAAGYKLLTAKQKKKRK